MLWPDQFTGYVFEAIQLCSRNQEGKNFEILRPSASPPSPLPPNLKGQVGGKHFLGDSNMRAGGERMVKNVFHSSKPFFAAGG